LFIVSSSRYLKSSNDLQLALRSESSQKVQASTEPDDLGSSLVRSTGSKEISRALPVRLVLVVQEAAPCILPEVLEEALKVEEALRVRSKDASRERFGELPERPVFVVK